MKTSYEKFVIEANEKISSFWDNKYDTFESDLNKDKLTHLLNREHVKKNLGEIKFAYAFTRMVKDVFSLEFLQKLKDFANQFGFEPSERFFEAMGLELLAIDLVLNYPLLTSRTYDRSDFRGIGFVRDESIEGTSITRVAYIPLLGMEFDKRKKPVKIKPLGWTTIGVFLGQLKLK